MMNTSSPHATRRKQQRASRRSGRWQSHRALRAGWGALLLLLAATVNALAMPLGEYRSRVDQAASELESVARSGEKEGAPEMRSEHLKSALDEVERAVPKEETVEWRGEKFQVDNRWIEDEIESLRQLQPSDPLARSTIESIARRLRAIAERMTELETRGAGTAQTAAATAAAADAPVDKEQERARLEKILSRAEYNPQPPGKTILQQIWEKIKEWWNSLFGNVSVGGGRGSWFSFIAVLVIFGLAAAVIAYAVWKILLLLQSRKAKRRTDVKEPRVVLGERLAPDQKAADLLAEAEALARRGEIRAAIRKAYVALLCELGDRKVLTLAQHKTNRDYLRAVRERRPLLDEMQKLTSSFENHWYGFRLATNEEWTAFLTGYQQALKSVTGDE